MVLESLEERAVPNGAPLALDDGPFTVLHGQALNNIAILANDSDPNNDPLSVEIQQHPSHGYAYFDSYTGTAIYMPFLNYAGPDSFTYKLWDGQAYSNIATVTINVTNQPPVAADDGPFSVLHGQSITGIDLKANDSDADGDDLTVFIQQYPSHGYLYREYNGTWAYQAYPDNTVKLEVAAPVGGNLPLWADMLFWVDGTGASPNSGNFAGAAWPEIALSGPATNYLFKAGTDLNLDGTLQSNEVTHSFNVRIINFTGGKCRLAADWRRAGGNRLVYN